MNVHEQPMSGTSADNTQSPYTPQQTAEMLRNFQAAVLAASDHLLRLVSTLHYIYGAAVAGRGDTLKAALDGYDSRLIEHFEAVLAVFRQRGIPILEEYTDLLPFILETQTGISTVTVSHAPRSQAEELAEALAGLGLDGLDL
jgi:hypothetical protein